MLFEPLVLAVYCSKQNCLFSVQLKEMKNGALVIFSASLCDKRTAQYIQLKRLYRKNVCKERQRFKYKTEAAVSVAEPNYCPPDPDPDPDPNKRSGSSQ